MSTLVFDPAISLRLVALLAACALLLIGWSYFAWATLPSRLWRLLLLGLRALCVGIVVVVLLGPSRARTETIVEKAPVAVLLDRSKSMDIPDCPGSATRAATLQDILAENRKVLEEAAAKYHLVAMDFGATASTLELEQLWQPPSYDEQFRSGTDLGGALQSLLSELRGRSNGAVLLISDGRGNGARDPVAGAAAFKSRGIPIYAVPLGQQTATAAIKDAKIANVIAPPHVRLHAAVNIEAEVSALGLANQPLAVTLKVDGKPAGSKTWIPAQMKDTTRLAFQLLASASGQHEIVVEAAPVPGEIDLENNRFSTLLHVDEGRTRLVYLEGRLRWEYRYLRDFLRTLKLVDAELFNCFGDGPLPEEAFNLNAHSVMFLGDLSAPRFSTAQLAKLKAAVESGAGLIVIGGLKNLGPGSYTSTTLAELLPVIIGAADKQIEQPFKVRTTPAAPFHYAIRLSDEEQKNAELWSKLPELDGRVATGGLKLGALPLLLAADASGEAVLAGQNYGKGRTLAFTADTTWKWAIGTPEEKESYRRFWQQVVRWLGHWDELPAGTFVLGLPKYRFLRGDAVEIAAELFAAGPNAVSDARVALAIRAPSGREESLTPALCGSTYESVYYPKESGRYKVRGQARLREGKKLESDEVQFLVTTPDPELDEPLANHELLRRVAETSGGRLIARAEVKDVLAGLLAQDRNTTLQKTLAPQPLWDRPLTLWLFCGLLTLEWALRRYKRLV
ncbi:MAG: glutamine amidotransferase [Planctomycetota bacterium]